MGKKVAVVYALLSVPLLPVPMAAVSFASFEPFVSFLGVQGSRLEASWGCRSLD